MKCKKLMSNFIVGIIAISIMAAFTLAAPSGGTVTEGSAETWAGTSSTTANTEGGNITEVNITGYAQTGRWAGFWGEVSGGIRLADSSANVFYEWTVTDVTNAVVYAADGAVSNWGSIAAATTGDLPGYLTTGATDNFTNTFNETGAFTSASLNVAGTSYAKTWQGGSQGALSTYALKDGATLIWAGKAIADTTSFDGTTVDYQVLVPANATVSTFNFYLELP